MRIRQWFSLTGALTDWNKQQCNRSHYRLSCYHLHICTDTCILMHYIHHLQWLYRYRIIYITQMKNKKKLGIYNWNCIWANNNGDVMRSKTDKKRQCMKCWLLPLATPSSKSLLIASHNNHDKQYNTLILQWWNCCLLMLSSTKSFPYLTTTHMTACEVHGLWNLQTSTVAFHLSVT